MHFQGYEGAIIRTTAKPGKAPVVSIRYWRNIGIVVLLNAISLVACRICDFRLERRSKQSQNRVAGTCWHAHDFSVRCYDLMTVTLELPLALRHPVELQRNECVILIPRLYFTPSRLEPPIHVRSMRSLAPPAVYARAQLQISRKTPYTTQFAASSHW